MLAWKQVGLRQEGVLNLNNYCLLLSSNSMGGYQRPQFLIRIKLNHVRVRGVIVNTF